MANALSRLFGKTKGDPEANEIQPRELQNAGIDIKKGDARLKKGITFKNLTGDEKKKLVKSRKSSS